MAETAVGESRRLATNAGRGMGARKLRPGNRIDIDNDYVAVNEYFHELGWGDGLPVMPPTEDAVATMIGRSPPATKCLASCRQSKGR